MSGQLAQSGCSLIGLPGSGKSTAGVQLAKLLTKPFVDTDIELQSHIGMSLQHYLDQYGVDALREAESRCVSQLNLSNCVVATGGSVVYGERAMRALKAQSQVVYLQISLDTMVERLGDFSCRGIAADLSAGLEPMYEERISMYKHHADFTVDANLPVNAVLQKLLDI